MVAISRASRRHVECRQKLDNQPPHVILADRLQSLPNLIPAQPKRHDHCPRRISCISSPVVTYASQCRADDVMWRLSRIGGFWCDYDYIMLAFRHSAHLKRSFHDQLAA